MKLIDYGFYWLSYEHYTGLSTLWIVDDQGSLVETSADALVYFFFS